MAWESLDVVKFDFEPILQYPTRKAKLTSAYNFLIIDPKGLQCETNL